MWLKQTPVDPGYYWYISDDEKEPQIVQCTTYAGNIRFNCVNWEGEYFPNEMLIHNGRFWTESIKPPEGWR